MFSEALNQRSVAQTSTPNSRRRKIEDDARPQPRSNTRMPDRRSIAVVSHSVSQSALAPPLAFARTHSGLYCEARGKRSETSSVSVVMRMFLVNYSIRWRRTRGALSANAISFQARQSNSFVTESGQFTTKADGRSPSDGRTDRPRGPSAIHALPPPRRPPGRLPQAPSRTSHLDPARSRSTEPNHRQATPG